MHVRFEARGIGLRASRWSPGTWTVGGGDDDGIRFPGLPPRLLELDLARRPRLGAVRRTPTGGPRGADAGLRRWLLPRRAGARLSQGGPSSGL